MIFKHPKFLSSQIQCSKNGKIVQQMYGMEQGGCAITTSIWLKNIINIFLNFTNTESTSLYYSFFAHCIRAGFFNGPFVKSEKLSQVASSADKKCREDFYDFTADLRLQRGRAYISLSFHVKKS